MNFSKFDRYAYLIKLAAGATIKCYIKASYKAQYMKTITSSRRVRLRQRNLRRPQRWRHLRTDLKRRLNRDSAIGSQGEYEAVAFLGG